MNSYNLIHLLHFVLYNNYNFDLIKNEFTVKPNNTSVCYYGTFPLEEDILKLMPKHIPFSDLLEIKLLVAISLIDSDKNEHFSILKDTFYSTNFRVRFGENSFLWNTYNGRKGEILYKDFNVFPII